MAWDHEWQDPAERKAVEEAAQKMAEARAQADARTQALADAVRDGFGMLSSAILAGSDHPMSFVLDRYRQAVFGSGGQVDDPADGPDDGLLPPGPVPAAPLPTDDGIDDLLADDTAAAVEDCTCPANGIAHDCPVHGWRQPK
jgi:hypothetical protein